jgi:hypothetical protein
MRLLLIGLLAAVQIGGAFGEAAAEIEELAEESMIIDLEVEVGVSAEAVVAHFSFDGESDFTMPLLDRGDGVFGVRTELEPLNYVIVFEAVGAGDVSEAWTLTSLGADFGAAVESDGAASVDGSGDELSDETRRVGWLALALAAASLSALAFWVLGGDDRETVTARED